MVLFCCWVCFDTNSCFGFFSFWIQPTCVFPWDQNPHNSGSSLRVLHLQIKSALVLGGSSLLEQEKKGGNEKPFKKENKISGSPLYECTAGLWCISMAYLAANYNVLCFIPPRGLGKNCRVFSDSILATASNNSKCFFVFLCLFDTVKGTNFQWWIVLEV